MGDNLHSHLTRYKGVNTAAEPPKPQCYKYV